MKNIVQGILEEIDRCEVLIGHYEEIGPVGAFGKMMIRRDIDAAKEALGSGDTIAMIASLEALRGCK